MRRQYYFNLDATLVNFGPRSRGREWLPHGDRRCPRRSAQRRIVLPIRALSDSATDSGARWENRAGPGNGGILPPIPGTRAQWAKREQHGPPTEESFR